MNSILLCITAGRGPVECHRAVARVAVEMQSEAERIGLCIAWEAGSEVIGSLLLSVSGAGADLFARSWEGSVLWRARSEERSGIRRQNWFVGVKRMTTMGEPAVLQHHDVRFATMRAGGPGGQHQNRTESAVRAVHTPTGVVAIARDERSQHRNRALALERLRSLLGAIHERDAARKARSNWLNRIDVERGKPIRIYAGPDFKRVDPS